MFYDTHLSENQLKIIQPEVAHGDDSNGIDLAEPPLPWTQPLRSCLVKGIS